MKLSDGLRVILRGHLGWGKCRLDCFIGMLLGAPISESQCRKVLREGFQRQRAAAALELALMRPDEALFEVRAPGWRQQRLLQHTV